MLHSKHLRFFVAIVLPFFPSCCPCPLYLIFFFINFYFNQEGAAEITPYSSWQGSSLPTIPSPNAGPPIEFPSEILFARGSRGTAPPLYCIAQTKRALTIISATKNTLIKPICIKKRRGAGIGVWGIRRCGNGLARSNQTEQPCEANEGDTKAS